MTEKFKEEEEINLLASFFSDYATRGTNEKSKLNVANLTSTPKKVEKDDLRSILDYILYEEDNVNFFLKKEGDEIKIIKRLKSKKEKVNITIDVFLADDKD